MSYTQQNFKTTNVEGSTMADDLTREPLVADLSLHLPGICVIKVKGRCDGA